jgi:hypothetical protein
MQKAALCYLGLFFAPEEESDISSENSIHFTGISGNLFHS